jgi:hypothetical protein
MPPSTTVISDPPLSLKAYETDLIIRVQEHGWQTTSVGADENGDPAFSYTTGFWLTVDQPDVIVFDFPPQLSHDVFGQMIRKAREGHRFPMGQPIDDILSNEGVYLFPIKREAGVEYLRSSNWFYRRTDFPAVQLVWADGAGRYPWDDDFDAALLKLQPDISARGWREELDGAT